MIRNEENPLFLMEIESSRFSQNLLSKIKKNLFWKIVKTFDKCITNEYGGEMRRLFSLTYKNAHKKVIVYELSNTQTNHILENEL